MPVIQFESTIEGNFIRIPEQYRAQIPDMVTVTLGDAEKPTFRPKTKRDKPLSIEEFSDLKLDTRK